MTTPTLTREINHIKFEKYYQYIKYYFVFVYKSHRESRMDNPETQATLEYEKENEDEQNKKHKR